MKVLAICTLVAVLYSADAFDCYKCTKITFTQKTTSSATIQNLITTLEGSPIDGDNCPNTESTYTGASTVQKATGCTTKCYKSFSSATFTIGSENFRYDTYKRDCAASTNPDGADTCIDHSTYYETQTTALINQTAVASGSTLSSISYGGNICYCNTGDCNGSTALGASSMLSLLLLALFLVTVNML